MKNYFNTTLFFLFAFSIIGFAQINFEKGYYINNQGEQINCLIKNVDWRNNPIDFEYKLTKNSAIKTETINRVSEFVIENISKYIRANVEIDRSSKELNNLSIVRTPKFIEEKLFLKVLVEGDKNLYRYYFNGLERYFYDANSSKIVQLVYKMYEVKDYSGGTYYKYNEMFKQQLFNNLNCQNNSMNSFMNIAYKKKPLIKVFTKHNECKGIVGRDYEKNIQRDWFNLRIRPGINFSSLEIEGPVGSNGSVDFEAKSNFRFGVEAEFVLPFNKNKWSVIIEPTYQRYKSETTAEYFNSTQAVQVDYKSIVLPVGMRYKVFLNDKNVMFLNAVYVSNFVQKTKVEFERRTNLEGEATNNFAFGLGYEFNNKLSVEFRVSTGRNLLGNYVFFNSDYKISSIIMGYKLF